VLTIEGLAQLYKPQTKNGNGALHPLQEAFIKYGAVQCGFCIPGQLLTAYALLQHNPDPSEEQIRQALKDTLCRCAGYPSIVSAVQAAAQHHVITEARFTAREGRAITIVSSTSKSTGKVIESYLQAGTPWAAYLPNGNADRVTYYLGLLVLAEAFAAPSAHLDLLDAYEELITATKGGAILETHKDLLCRVADEVYYAAVRRMTA